MRPGALPSVRTAAFDSIMHRASRLLIVVSAIALVWTGREAGAADAARIKQSVDKGAAFLKGDFQKSVGTPELSLVALALLKAGHPENSPEFRTTVEEIRSKIKDGKYHPKTMHVYEAGGDATFLADFDGENLQPEIKAVVEYLLSVQFDTGAWDYPKGSSHDRGTNGDTSVNQYGCLGLWAAERAGVEVPQEKWEQVLHWLLTHQNQDGGYSYVPGTTQGLFGGRSDLSMTFAGMGSILIATRHVYPGLADEIYVNPEGVQEKRDKPETGASDALGPLQKIDLTRPPDAAANPAAGASRVSLSDIKAALAKGKNWINVRYRPYNDTGTATPFYYFYAVERFGALANVKQFGAADWFDLSSTALIDKQNPDGSYPSNNYTNPRIDTSFAVLFLTRSTGKILKRTEAVPTVGGGLLTGGKGEPGIVTAAKREPTPLDKLLASLQNPGSLNLEEVQTDLIEQVQIGDKSELVGQTDLLIKLMKHPHGEVRRTAVWALGRTNDLKLARYLVERLMDDSDAGVLMEAHAALSWLSRRFDGFDLPVNPLDSVAEDATDEQKRSAIEGWRSRALRAWGAWYLKVRPYSERGDAFEARLQQALGQPITR
jgi:hypothetical protein